MKKKKYSRIFRRNVILNLKGYIQNSCNRLEIFYRKCNATSSASLHILWFSSSCGFLVPTCMFNSSFSIVKYPRYRPTLTMSAVIKVPHFQ